MELRVAVFAKRFSIIISRIVGIAQGRILHSILFLFPPPHPLPPCPSLRDGSNEGVEDVEPALKTANRTFAIPFPPRQIRSILLIRVTTR